MTHFDVFNGDADGLCALHQLRLAQPRESTLITGVKRDIDLVRQIRPAEAGSVTVLDVSLDKNRKAVDALLEAEVPVQYFDHHFPGEWPTAPGFDGHINTDADTCTGLIVNDYLQGAHLAWAVTAAFGDNLLDCARRAAEPLGLDATVVSQLEELGTLLNYNGYGGAIDDLFFAPADLYARIHPYQNPLNFIAEDDAFETLQSGYAADMQQARDIAAEHADPHTALFIFPNAPFSRRVSGVYSNHLAQSFPDRAHALLSRLPSGDYLVSVRAPLSNRTGADELCRGFDTGGGRKGAAGINRLPESELERFANAFRDRYSAAS